MNLMSRKVGGVFAGLIFLALSGCVSTVSPAALSANNPTSESAPEGKHSQIILDDTTLNNLSGDELGHTRTEETKNSVHSHMHMKGHSHE